MTRTNLHRRRDSTALSSWSSPRPQPLFILPTNSASRTAATVSSSSGDKNWAQKSVDVFTLEIIQEGLISAAEEMFYAFGRTSKSPVIYEVLDYARGITDDHEGQLIAQAAGVPGFLGTLDLAVKQTISKHKGNIHAGDVFITNDPYSNGIHLNDVTLIRPIIYRGTLVGFAVNKGHWSDVGGMHFGSCLHATEIYQEGLFFPIIKLYDRGNPLNDLIDLIRHNVRIPEMTTGDMYARRHRSVWPRDAWKRCAPGTVWVRWSKPSREFLLEVNA